MNVFWYLKNNIFIIILSILSPILGIVTSLSLCSYRKNISRHHLLLFIILAFWLSAINATKVPASDQVAYAQMYFNVPDFNFFDAIKHLTYEKGYSEEAYNEPIYKAFCWIGYYLTFGNVYWYFALITFLVYMASFYSIYKMLSYKKCNIVTILSAIIICAFFYQFFNQTNHAIRQYLAGIFVMYAIVKKQITNKNPWLLYIISALTHKSTLLFLLFLMIPNKYVNDKRFVLISSICIVLFSFFLSNVSTALMFIGGEESYLLSKAAAESKEFSEMNKLILYGVSIPILYVCYRGLFFSDEDSDKRMNFFYFVTIMLTLFVLACGKNTLFQGRYFFYIYFFVPYLVPLLFKKNMTFNIIISMFLPIHFMYNLSISIWDYADVCELLFYPLPMLLNYQ